MLSTTEQCVNRSPRLSFSSLAPLRRPFPKKTSTSQKKNPENVHFSCTFAEKGTRRCALRVCGDAFPEGGGAGRGRRRLFVAVNRSVSDGIFPGAAKISLPISSGVRFYSVIYFNACSPGSSAGSQGLRRVRERSC